MPKQVKNAATTVLDKLGADPIKTRQSKHAQRSIQELNEFAGTAEALLRSARDIAPLIAHPLSKGSAEIIEKAPGFAAGIKEAAVELTKIHKQRERFINGPAMKRDDVNIECIKISQAYVEWIQKYQQDSLPVAAEITDAFMAIEESKDE